MAIFSVNQARQVYVSNHEIATNAESIKKGGVPGTVFVPKEIKEDFYIEAVNGLGEPIRSDRVEPGKVVSVSLAKAKKPKVNKYTIKLSEDILNGEGKVPRGYSFIVKVIFDHFIGMTEVDKYVKIGEVYTRTAMAKKDFCEALCYSLNKNFTNENKIYPLCKIECNHSSDEAVCVTITECVQEWHLGTMASEVLPLHIEIAGVLLDGVVVPWAKVEKTSEDAKDPLTDKALTNGRTIADMEYFYLGERGDIYRNVGWPNVITTKYLVDPDKEYNVIDIQYYWSGDNEDIQHSAKTLTLIGVNDEGGVNETLVKQIGVTLGLSKVFVDGKPTSTAE